MPLSFMHRLREILRKDREEQAKQYQQHAASVQQMNGAAHNNQQRRPQIPSFPSSAIEDIMDELS